MFGYRMRTKWVPAMATCYMRLPKSVHVLAAAGAIPNAGQ